MTARSFIVSTLAAAVLLLAATCASRRDRPGDAVDGLSDRAGVLEWEGLRLGMDRRDAERRIGAPLTLRVQESPVCGTHFSEVTYRGHQLMLQWSDDANPLLQSVFVATTSDEPLASLASRLKSRLPAVRFINGPHDPDESEATDTTPLYRHAGSGEIILLRSDGSPWSGIFITDERCLE